MIFDSKQLQDFNLKSTETTSRKTLFCELYCEMHWLFKTYWFIFLAHLLM